MAAVKHVNRSFLHLLQAGQDIALPVANDNNCNCLCPTAKRTPLHHRFKYDSFLFDKYIVSDAKNRLLK